MRGPLLAAVLALSILVWAPVAFAQSDDEVPPTTTTSTSTGRFTGDVTINPQPDPEPDEDSFPIPLGLVAVGGGVVTLLVIIGAIRLSGDH